MPHGECPLAITLREGRGIEAIIEKPNGKRVPIIPYPTLLKDPSGQVNGAINLLVDIGERKQAEIDSSRLASIVACSDDAIISKTLDGRITSWNAGATHIFGYEPEEMIGESIKRIIPPELYPDEDEILAKLRRGEPIDHFETVRVAKDGRRIDVSLTVSPLRNKAEQLVGASKIARDISERKRKEQMQRLLFHELNRVKKYADCDTGDRKPVIEKSGESRGVCSELRWTHSSAGADARSPRPRGNEGRGCGRNRAPGADAWH